MKSIALVPALLLCVTASAVVDDSYFPIKTKADGEGVTEFESKWYGQSLQRMNEPRLPEVAKDVNADIYRITILPTWGNSIASEGPKTRGIVQPVGSPIRWSGRI
jgi:hypothetical protein